MHTPFVHIISMTYFQLLSEKLFFFGVGVGLGVGLGVGDGSSKEKPCKILTGVGLLRIFRVLTKENFKQISFLQDNFAKFSQDLKNVVIC